MAKPSGGKRPQDLRHTLRRFMDYLGRHKIMLGVVGLLAAVSALAALLGTYMIRPIVNGPFVIWIYTFRLYFWEDVY